MKRESLIKLLIVSGVILGFTPNLEANAATTNKSVAKEASNQAVKTGWINKDGKRYYIKDNGEYAKYWNTIDGKGYYFDSDGEMVKGWLTRISTNERYYFNEDGIMQTGFLNVNGKTYYMKKDGAMVKYWNTINGNTYYFDSDGEMVKGWLKKISNNEWYYFNEKGIMQKGWLNIGDKTYYLNETGVMVTGKVKIDNKEYNFDENGVLEESKTGWINKDGKIYYMQDNGELAKYWTEIDGKTYYFTGRNELVTGWLTRISDGEKFYFNKDGVMQTGFINVDGNTYYMQKDGRMVRYWNDIDGKSYYFTGQGVMVTGWVQRASNNESYYFDEDGAMHKGWLDYNGNRYYMQDNGTMKKYWLDLNGKTYYFDSQGKMVKSWLRKISTNEWYYFNWDGAMHKGWLTLGDKKYYFNDNGVMVTGQIEIDGEFYEFNNKGELKDNPFGEGKITNYTMNLREKPSLDSEVLTTMAPNSKVQILGREKGDLTYYHVKYVKDGQVYYGYVSIYLNGNTAVQVYEDNKDDNYLGILSEKYESNGDPGCISSGEGDYGGKSYGAWQLSSKLGSLDNFVEWLSSQNAGFYKELTDARKLDNGSNCGAYFDKAWKDIASNHYNEFYNLQHEYTKITFYNDLIRRLKNSGDYTKVLNNFAVENVLWSTAVQHGGYGAYKIIAPLTHISDPEKFITAVYNERGRRNSSGGLVYFPNCSKAVQEAVASRYIRERNDAIRMYEDSL